MFREVEEEELDEGFPYLSSEACIHMSGWTDHCWLSISMLAKRRTRSVKAGLRSKLDICQSFTACPLKFIFRITLKPFDPRYFHSSLGNQSIQTFSTFTFNSPSHSSPDLASLRLGRGGALTALCGHPCTTHSEFLMADFIPDSEHNLLRTRWCVQHKLPRWSSQIKREPSWWQWKRWLYSTYLSNPLVPLLRSALWRDWFWLHASPLLGL